MRFVDPGPAPKRKRRLSREQSGVRHDMKQFYPMKATLEALLGHPIYLRLKETATVTDWKSALSRLLDAIHLSINSTVHVADQEWRDDIAELIHRGQESIGATETMDDLLASLSATLAQIVFMQIGCIPRRTGNLVTVPLLANWWALDRYRTVQYVQTKKQKEALKRVRKNGQSREH